MAKKLTPEQEDFKPEQGADMQNGIDLYAIARKALNNGLNKAGIQLDPTAKDKITIKIVAELGARELRTEGDYEKLAGGIMQRYFDEADRELTPEPDKEQPSPGSLEKSLTGKKVALADALPSELDLHGIIRSAIDNKLNEEQDQYIKITPKNKALLVSDLVQLLESHNLTTAEEAEKIARQEVKYCLEPYRNTKKVVEQPEDTPENMPEPRTAGEYADEFPKEKKGLGNLILATSAAAFLGIAGICGYYTFFKEKPKPAVVALENDDLEDVLRVQLSAKEKTIQELKNKLAAKVTEPSKEEREKLEQRRKNLYDLLEMKRTGEIVSFDEEPFKDIITTEPTWKLKQAGYFENPVTPTTLVPPSASIDYERLEKINKNLVEKVAEKISEKLDEKGREITKAVRESVKVDSEPIAPGPTPEELAQGLLADVEKEKQKTPATGITPTTPNPYSLKVTPYAGMKLAFNAEDKPDPMPVYGLELEVGKENGSVYLGAEYGEIDESETISAGSLDLKSKATTFRLGGKLSTSKERKLIGSIGAGARVTLEKNEITGRVGTYDVDDSRDETIFGVEATAGLEFRLTDNISLTAGATYGHNFKDDNSNVTDDLTGRVGVVVKF